MRLFGRVETVPVRGSRRRAKVFVPSLIKHVLISLIIALVPLVTVLSYAHDMETILQEVRGRSFIGFSLFMLVLALVVFWGNRMFARDARRMLAGELTARTGVLWAMGQQADIRWHSGPCRMAVEIQDAAGNPLRNEIYRIPEELYKEYREKRSGSAWLVELAVLPPANGPEFSEERSPLVGGKAFSDPMGFGEMPVSRSEVAEIFYLERQPYGCVSDRGALFSRWW